MRLSKVQMKGSDINRKLASAESAFCVPQGTIRLHQKTTTVGTHLSHPGQTVLESYRSPTPVRQSFKWECRGRLLATARPQVGLLGRNLNLDLIGLAVTTLSFKN